MGAALGTLLVTAWLNSQGGFCVTTQERAQPPTPMPPSEGLKLVGVVAGGDKSAAVIRQGTAANGPSVWMRVGATLWARWQLVAVGRASALLTNGTQLFVLRLPRQPRVDWPAAVAQAPTCDVPRKVPPAAPAG